MYWVVLLHIAKLHQVVGYRPSSFLSFPKAQIGTSLPVISVTSHENLVVGVGMINYGETVYTNNQ